MMAFKRLKDDHDVVVCGLMTAFHGLDEVVNLHYVPRSIIEKQAEALGLELYPIFLSDNAPNEEYERKHKALFEQLKTDEIHEIAFGDIHLEPIREYRDCLLADSGMKGNYPLWQESPHNLLDEFLDAGYEAIITAIDELQVPVRYLAQKLDDKLSKEFESLQLDPCGENGEYHTFVYNGPGFNWPVKIEPGGVFEKDFRPGINMKLLVNELKMSK